MSRAARWFLVPGCVAILAAGCGDDILSPDRQRHSDVAAARAVSGTLSTWPVSASRIDLSWADNVKNETGWEIHRSATGASGAFTLLASLGVNSTYYSNTGLDELKEYCFRVRSFRRNGGNTSYGTFLPTSCSTTFGRPTAPSNVSAVPAHSSLVDVAWTDNASDEHANRLERAADPAGPWQTAASLGPNVQSYRDFARTPDQVVCYRVIAAHSTNGESSPSDIDCTAPPRAPSSIAATANGTSIDVTWTDASNVEDGYQVLRAVNDFVFVAIAALPANASRFSDASVVPDTEYWYRVHALKDGGRSDQSNLASTAVAVGPPRAPESVVAYPAGSSVAGVSWFNPSATATGFRVERSTDGQASWVTAGTQAWIGFYDAERATEELVCYRVYASNSFGESSVSNVDCTTPPAAPSDVYTAPTDAGSVVVGWKDNSNVEEFYEIWTILCWVDWNGEWYCEYWNAYQVSANSTSLEFYPYSGEYFAEIYAFSDGGYSDPGTWATGDGESGGLAIVGAKRVTRPTKGARAPVPPLSARTNGVRGKLPPGKKLP